MLDHVFTLHVYNTKKNYKNATGDLFPNHPQKLTQWWNPCSANGEHLVVSAPAFFQTHNYPPPPLHTHEHTRCTHVPFFHWSSFNRSLFMYWSQNDVPLIFPRSFPFDLLVVFDFSWILSPLCLRVWMIKTLLSLDGFTKYRVLSMYFDL